MRAYPKVLCVITVVCDGSFGTMLEPQLVYLSKSLIFIFSKISVAVIRLLLWCHLTLECFVVLCYIIQNIFATRCECLMSHLFYAFQFLH